jgi:hypothetical protein
VDIGVYDSILGFDWLRAHSPMNCDWDKRTLEFYHQGQWAQIQGDCAKVIEIPQVHAVQVHKWLKGNAVWAFVLLEQVVPRKEEVKGQLATLLTEFQDLFSQPTTLPPKRVFDHYIPLLPGSVPVNARPYRYSPLHKDEIERQVAELLKIGLIVPSVSSFASPVLLVQKKDGTWRFCIDYRKLNDMTVKNRFPMPLVDEILDELAGTQYFSSLDMTAGYHQIRMGEEDEHKTSFKTYHGHYQFRVMPFGLTNAPATFQCAMNSILEPFLRKFVLIFIDDILIYNPTLQDHVQHL